MTLRSRLQEVKQRPVLRGQSLQRLILTAEIQREYRPHHHHHHHLSLNREGRRGSTDDFATSFLHVSLFSTALWNLANSRPIHSLMLSSHLFLCLPCLLPPFTVPCKMVLMNLMNGRHDQTTAVCVSLSCKEVFAWFNYMLDLGMDFLVGNMVFLCNV